MTEPRTIDYGRYTLRHPWPADCFVQGGSHGLVLSKTGNYQTAFVEAFPSSPSTFLRGEGATMEAAEDACWAQYERITACDHTAGYEARGYRNGAGFCKGCGMFASDVFDLAEIGSVCVVCGTPAYWTVVDGNIYCRDDDPGERPDGALAGLMWDLSSDRKDDSDE